MAKRTRAELIEAKKAELAALEASVDKSKVTERDKLVAKRAVVQARHDKSGAELVAIDDKIATLNMEIAESGVQTEAPANAEVAG